MVRMFKQFLCLTMLTLVAERAVGFTILGTREPYQVSPLSYFILAVGPAGNLANTLPEIGGPKNLGEEFRRNTPILNYSFDSSFLDYFGSKGVAAVEEAIAIMNSVTNVSAYSSDLSEWPMEAQAFNYKAQALNLTDLKSWALSTLVEQMGLGEPERFTWTLHDREVGPGGCPGDVQYLVVKRNFEPWFTPLDQLLPTSYVNGTLYSYVVIEVCTGPILADAIEFPVDPSAGTFTAVASYSIPFGAYFTGLTRDDVGGFRYLLRASNLNIESAGPNTLTVTTNFNATQLLFTSNLTLLVSQALTNNPAALQALYPNLVISSSTEIYTNLVSTNVFFFFTNYPWSPANTPTLAFQTNLTTNVFTWYSHTFANVVTNTYYTNGFITILDTTIGPRPFGLPNQLYTNVTSTTLFTNFINGDYYILPTNSDCGVHIINTQLLSILSLTNTPVVATNVTGATNVNGSQFSESEVFFLTNRIYVINPVPCVSNSVALRQGIEHVQFVRRDFDSLLNRFFYPITNEYTLVGVTNFSPLPQRVRRTVTAPDILFAAEDLATEGPAITGFGESPTSRNLNFTTNANSLNLFGPGTIEASTRVAFNKVGPLYWNSTLLPIISMDEATQVRFLTWASFDGSTNEPVVYPNGTSILDVEQAAFIQVAPVYLPEAFTTTTALHTNFYSAQLQVTSYTPAFVTPATWALAPGSPGLPPGLTLTDLNASTAVISGTPTMIGTFDFVVRVTDSQSRTTDRSYYIKVNP